MPSEINENCVIWEMNKDRPSNPLDFFIFIWTFETPPHLIDKPQSKRSNYPQRF
ncbi:hypothetical protein BVRB_2g044800 isoform B [Beta vulgaris subsp. vulgaris]|uniref:Uncharacterized protein n=1 Tax=Beta vulgaris subsp. vulgaris TaxID=3555 RepID=A0A0J8BEK3_BETVV|nr:hypothetical protein BVRB_2g044800 isoform B [Beta vulgaris subsp. vulgaris]